MNLNSYEIQHRTEANRFLMLILALHVPAFTLFSLLGLGNVIVALVGGIVICAIPAFLLYANPGGMGTSVSISSAMMGMSMLLIYLGEGKIEYHFHVFCFLAVLCYFASMSCLIVAAGTIAVHHVLGWWLVPRALFNYDAGFADVLVHALFVVVETAICCLIARQFAETARMRGVLEEQVRNTAEQVAAGSEDIANFVVNFARSATSQSSLVDRMAETSARMQSQVSGNMAATASTRQTIAKTVDEIAAAHQRLDRINEEMQAVSMTSRKISGIVNLMMEIARQTNILAVNASIEASRSGNSGGGFGVIADQVRDLAVRTSEATTEINTLIENSVGQVESSADGIKIIAENFAHLNGATQQMRNLLESVHQMGISQAGGIEEISTAMRKISLETQQFAAAAHDTAETSSQLSELAGGLRNTLAAIH